MRILVLSDIHDNIGNIRLLRAQEENCYDAVIIGGDIGNAIVAEFYPIIDSFQCPAYVVYGNWDHDQEYTERLSERCVLLHHRLVTVGSYVLTGFSGSPTSWGRNPIYLDEERQANARHQSTLAAMNSLYKKIDQEKISIEKRLEERLADLDKKTKDRRRSSYINKSWELVGQKMRAMDRAGAPLRKFQKSPAYRTCMADIDGANNRALLMNRSKLFDLIRSEVVSPDKLILLTHERLYRIAEEGVTPLLHIFGHRHEHTFKPFKGTYYLNAAAVDHGMSEEFGRIDLQPLGYCVVELNGSTVTVHRRLIPPKKPWKSLWQLADR